MKKSYLLLFVLFLCGCQKNSQSNISLNVVCPTGAPALAFYTEASNSNFETNSVPSNIIAMMNNNSNKDIVVFDTVSGIKAINNGAKYKLAASITFGNFYLVSTGNDENDVMEKDDTIVLFGKNQTPDYVFHYLYGNAFDDSIEWVGNVQDAAKCVKTSKNLVTGSSVDYVFVAEPVLTSVKTETTTIYANIQDEYRTKSNGLEMIQASVFVSNSTSKEAVDSFLKNLESNITSLKNNHSLLETNLSVLSEEEQASIYGIKANVGIITIDRLGLGYKKAIDNKNAIDAFINLFGEQNTNEEIYYK